MIACLARINPYGFYAFGKIFLRVGGKPDEPRFWVMLFKIKRDILWVVAHAAPAEVVKYNLALEGKQRSNGIDGHVEQLLPFAT